MNQFNLHRISAPAGFVPEKAQLLGAFGMVSLVLITLFRILAGMFSDRMLGCLIVISDHGLRSSECCLRRMAEDEAEAPA